MEVNYISFYTQRNYPILEKVEIRNKISDCGEISADRGMQFLSPAFG